MIENNKPQLIEEEQEESEKDNKKFLLVGTIIIGSILALMVFCLIMIFVLEGK